MLLHAYLPIYVCLYVFQYAHVHSLPTIVSTIWSSSSSLFIFSVEFWLQNILISLPPFQSRSVCCCCCFAIIVFEVFLLCLLSPSLSCRSRNSCDVDVSNSSSSGCCCIVFIAFSAPFSFHQKVFVCLRLILGWGLPACTSSLVLPFVLYKYCLFIDYRWLALCM